MADNTIDIGFTVANDELEAGLSGSLQQIASTTDVIQNYFQTIRDAALAAKPALIDFNTALNDPGAASANTQRKAQEDYYASEVSQVERLKALHQISADDAIAEEIRVENARFDALQAELQAQFDAADVTLATQTKLQAQLDALETRHYAKLRQLDQKSITESEQDWKSIIAPIGNAFQSSLTGIIDGNETLRQAVTKLGESVISDFTNMAVKRATDWIASELTMTGATQSGEAARLAAKQAGDAAGKAADATAGSASVFGDANKAAASTYAATADIPIVGPVLAPVAAAGAFAAVMAFDVFSAAGGFDIPAGLNPVTQLHAREMVLPAGIADPLRASLAGGGGGGATNIHADFSNASFGAGVQANQVKTMVVSALRQAHREGAFS
jgi:hypothetical protein